MLFIRQASPRKWQDGTCFTMGVIRNINKISSAKPEEQRSLGRRKNGCNGNTDAVPAEVDFETLKWIQLASVHFLPVGNAVYCDYGLRFDF
jgi:hypothetical protein